ncbi:MAG: hypothetical protein Q8O92_08035 [Candidatus Latescibacter sp.]|nr:hypothetical protein [Candidatus Latescibacter sp.]
MRSHTSGILFPSGIVIFLILVFIGCGLKEMDSRWCDRTVTIDGIDSGAEWESARYFFDDEQVTVGLMNTESILYVRISTRDPRIQRELMAYGFTLWFNENGDKNKTLGIRYPFGSQGDSTMAVGNAPMNRSAASSHTDTLIASIPHEIELFGPQKGQCSTVSFVDAAKYGIMCQIGNTKDNLVYELQYPLQRTEACPYGISVNQIRNLVIYFETGKMIPVKTKQPEQKIRGRDRGNREPGSGLIGGHGGMGGMDQRNRMSNGPGLIRPEPLVMWLKVNLVVEGR